MNKKVLMVAVTSIAAVMLAFSISPVLARPFYLDISVEETYRMISSEGQSNTVVIDLRPNVAYLAGHLPGAINVPVLPPSPTWSVLENWISSPEGQSHLNDRIIIHCLGGLASPTGAQMLIDAGFKKVYNMEGGFNAWSTAGYPTDPEQTRGQKVPITLKFTQIGGMVGGMIKETPNGIVHRRETSRAYKVDLSIDGAVPIVGNDAVTASLKWWKDKGAFIYHEYNVITFEGGTFQGNSMLKITNFVAVQGSSPIFDIVTHGVFQGTGEFEGQTIVASYKGPQGGTWTGYLLKP